MPKPSNPYKRPGSPHWQILWIDGSGREQRKSTRTGNLRRAQAMLAQRRAEAEALRMGIFDRFASSRRRPLDEFVVDYQKHLTANERAKQYVDDVVRHLRLAIAGAAAAHVGDFTPASVARHLIDVRTKYAAKTHAAHVGSLRSFGRWLLECQLWNENPFASLRTAKKSDADRKFRRQGLTLEEVELLAEAAPVRHLQAYAESHGGRASDRADEFERIGRDRALLYWTAATTGLRAAELAAIRWEDLQLDGDDPSVAIGAKFTKNRRDAKLPLQQFVAKALEQARTDRSARTGKPVQQRDHVFHVPERIAEHVRRDAMHAGIIPTHRPADRRLDFHALRHSCVRILRQLGVPPEIAQRVMRHSDIRLTLQTYGSAEDEQVVATMRNRVPVPRMFSSLCSAGADRQTKRDETGPTDRGGKGAEPSTTAAG